MKDFSIIKVHKIICPDQRKDNVLAIKNVRGELVYKLKLLLHADFSVGFQVESNL